MRYDRFRRGTNPHSSRKCEPKCEIATKIDFQKMRIKMRNAGAFWGCVEQCRENGPKKERCRKPLNYSPLQLHTARYKKKRKEP